MLNQDTNYSLSEADKKELDKLVTLLEISSGTTIIFGITPEISPQHIVVKSLKDSLETTEESFEFYNFFYSEDSFHNFLYRLDDNKQQNTQTERKFVMAFGIDQLPTPRLVKEMKQLNLGREELFGRNLVLILWLNKNQFLDEFRQRAPDFWDWREKVVEFKTRNPLLYPYLEWLIAENSYLKISGVMQVNRQVDIFLDQVYVSLQAQWRQHITETSEANTTKPNVASVLQSQSVKFDEMDVSQDDLNEAYDYEALIEDSITVSSTKTVNKKIALSQAVRENPYSVILGAPGAGKTTLLRYLALHFAKTKRDDGETVIVGEDKEELGKTLLPVFFRIADFAEQLKQQPNLTLLEYLRQFYRQWEAHFQTEEEMGTQKEVAEFLLLRMRQGQCLMLLDGLDEVFDQESRKQIVKCINQFVDEFPNNKFVITSRIAGYRDVQLSGRFAEFTIEDMDSEQVELFLSRWCHTVEKAQQPDASEEQWQSRGNEQVQDILQSVEVNEGVKRLTTNPLLLTILALIHRNGDRLPNRRVKLYELAVQTLTEDWQLSKKLPDAPKVVLKETEVVELLAPLAYWMHEEKPSGVVSEQEVEENLAQKLAELNDDEPESESVLQAVGEFLRKVRETTGLFVERTPGFYGFMHLTFEEYFAARYIADNDPNEILQLIQNHLHEPRWNEPILLALGYYGIHFPTQVKKLIKKLFKNLEDYQPTLQHGEIQIKNSSSEEQTIIYLKAEDKSENNSQEVELKLKNLLFAGQVIAEVEVNSIFRKKLIRKLVITCLGIDTDDFGDDTTKQLLRLLRKIEQFYKKNEVIDLLKEFADDLTLSEEIRILTKTAILYVACCDSTVLVNYATEFVTGLEPFLFFCTISFVQNLGQDMTPALEASRKYSLVEGRYQIALDFITGISYIRKDKHDLAISILEDIKNQYNDNLEAFIDWGLAICYQEKKEYEKANQYYNNAKIYSEFIDSAWFWLSWGKCQSDYKKYEESLDYYQKTLSLIKQLGNLKYEAIILSIVGRAYQCWGKYQEAINYHQQSKELYQQLGRDKDIANQWYWLGNCYRLWGKYEQAVEYQNKDLEIRQQLNDQINIADAYYQLGRIYEDWGKYEQAVNFYQQSKDIYQQLGRNKSVINHWYRLSECYHSWGKYQQAVECKNQCLTISQQVDDQAGIAFAYYELGTIYQDWNKYEQAVEYKNKELEIYQRLDDQASIATTYYKLGRIYQDWGKYEQAVDYFQQSKDIYQQLGRNKYLANHWHRLGECYRSWGKYQQAVECGNQCLTISQQLNNQASVALAYYQLGSIYKDWGKYEQAINCHQQSKDIYQQLGSEKDIARRLSDLAYCYRLWGKYQQAIESQNQCLIIRQQLDEQADIALTYVHLGWVYQGWGKYEQAINCYQKSKDIYQQLKLNKHIASQWYNLADCYRLWSKYEQAIKYQSKCLEIRQQLNDQADIALTYYQLGRIYQDWGKYEQAVDYYQQSKELYKQLGRDKDIARRWNNLAYCYRLWGKYKQAVEYQNQVLTICQQLENQADIAFTYFLLGWIYKSWCKYEQAIDYYQQSKDIYQQLGQDKDVASQWCLLANCYRDSKDYKKAIEYCQKSLILYQQLGQNEKVAIRYRQLTSSQILLAKNTSNQREIFDLLTQAEENINQAIKINTTGEYIKNLAYDYIVFSLLCSERLRWIPNDSSKQEKILLFEEYYHKGFTHFDELGQAIKKSEQALNIARAYLEVEALENLDKSEEIAKECLQVSQDYNRRKLEAAARKLLGEIYQKRTQQNQPDAESIATHFLSESLQIYQDLDLQEKAAEVEQILFPK
ncbi:putative NTPase (NACHT family) [Rivularia sp. PCC 7116]|uniref:tetratricopeptide repeat protein n=1 Tax=Rivularia sp. PCC 7116 TaxID=373994 RepID=UPI00029EF61D|nr:tetratricopeptide repeat protein [Rivularia sp. PCC 7116]AFY55802.1 putative NTPase (NACHT family) [Rivularia sp. PCC 7116]